MAVTDYHVHTARCGHAGGATRDYVLAAVSRGLTEVAITDHVPLYFLPGDDPEPGLAMARSELPGYVEEVLALREELRGRVDVLLGIEADYAEGHEAALGALLAPYEWDVVLGSVHLVAGGWIDAPGAGARHEREGTANLWNEYYRLVAKAASSGLFDVMTHFDLPKKFGHRRPADCEAAEDVAVEAARAAGVAVEVSSAGLRKPVAEEYPGPALLAKLVGAGVPLVFSSDSHAPAEVAWGREQVVAAARAAGATAHVTFRKRTPTRHSL
jgi:histidinol-phosphatase (PHP family)